MDPSAPGGAAAHSSAEVPPGGGGDPHGLSGVPLREPLRRLVGDRTAKVLSGSLDLHTVGDLLRHYPRRYAERGELTELSRLEVDEHVTVMAEIARVSRKPMRARRGSMLEVIVTDGRAQLTLTFFNQSWRERDLRPGRRGLFAGKVGEFRGKRQLSHPDYQLLGDESDAQDASAFASALIPVYPAAAALPSWKVAQCVRVALDSIGDLPDPLPEPVRARHRLLPLREAWEKVHRPGSVEDVKAGRHRLKWDEAFVLQVALARRRAALAELPAKPRVPVPGGLLDSFDAALPFTLTDGQRAVGTQIAADLASDHPMHRLLQGEVGAGKTLVALRAMLAVVDAGGQAAMLAPTEVLAQQHHRSMVEMLGPLAGGGTLGAAERATRVVLLTGSQGAAARRASLLALASGDAGIVVGTHALIEDRVRFFDLGLVVVDEQHRFGVEQRDALRSKADFPPHLLVMTATPIPRTVAMTVFGDLETSVLDQLPAGRSAIATHVVPSLEKPAYYTRAWERMREEVAAGHQAYVVCPRIGDDGGDGGGADDGAGPGDGSDRGGEPGSGGPRRPPASVLEMAARLSEGPLAGLRVEVLHGRLPPERKDDVMRAFAAGAIDVLVATTVVEVGVNVPNATAMVVMDADRFGVSQLHQLRGRVGRGGAPGLCLLVTESEEGTPARARLDAVAATLDGFELSRIDLEQRREGDVLGASQSGRRSSLRVLGVIRDEKLIRLAREEAAELVTSDPDLTGHPALAAELAALVDADREEYLDKG